MSTFYLTADERFALIVAEKRAKGAAGQWHADLVAPDVAYVYDRAGRIVAVLDDSGGDGKRDRLTLLRQAVAAAAALAALGDGSIPAEQPAEAACLANVAARQDQRRLDGRPHAILVSDTCAHVLDGKGRLVAAIDDEPEDPDQRPDPLRLLLDAAEQAEQQASA